MWWKVDNSGPSGDGRHTQYLEERWEGASQPEDCDLELVTHLGGMVLDEKRSIEALEALPVWPAGTLFYHANLESELRSVRPDERVNRRLKWLDRGLRATEGSELLFLDPDNGLAVGLVKPREVEGKKFVFMDEVEAAKAGGASLLLYHHLGRIGSHVEQIEGIREQIKSRFRMVRRPLVARFHRKSARAFLLVPGSQPKAGQIEERFRKVAASSWSEHFQLYD